MEMSKNYKRQKPISLPLNLCLLNLTTKEYDIFPTTDINCKNTTPLHFTALVRVFKRYSETIKVMNSKVKYIRKFFVIKF